MSKTYTELVTLSTWEERLDYLMLLDNNVESPRLSSMKFYKSKPWLTTRDEIIFRDLGFDLGVFGHYIQDRVLVHHINPITASDIRFNREKLLDPNNLITISDLTHNYVHYGRGSQPDVYVERRPGDTKLW